MFFLLAFLLLSLLFPAYSPIQISCRCLPTDACWPHPDAWHSLNSSVHGRLLRLTPPASPCHDPNYDAQACNDAKKQWRNSLWRSDQPGAMQYTNWESYNSQSCLIETNRSTPCQQGSVPEFGIEAREASDVQQGVRFARKHNLRLVIKNTGHDNLGRSTASGSLSIWTHLLKTIAFHDSFTPQRCYGSKTSYRGAAMSAGVGAQWLEVYEAAHAHNVVVVGGGSPSVGNGGGYVQGGGHSSLSPIFGLAADNILEFEVVTADGELVLVNECSNRDLFWALRGGGGGTFGVVVSAVHKTHPPFTNLVAATFNVTTINIPNFRRFMEFFTAALPSLSDAGWSGYFYVSPPATLTARYVLPKMLANMSYAQHTFTTLLSYAEKQNMHTSLDVFSFSSFLDMYKTVLLCGPSGSTTCSDITTGFGVLHASRLIPRENFERLPAQVARTILQLIERGVRLVIGHQVAGGAVAARDKHFNAVNPAWRTALVHMLNVMYVPDGSSPQFMHSIGRYLSDCNALLRQIAPTSGSYLNEADIFEPDWQRSFFGEHYTTLQKIKEKVDPNGLFVCKLCVGSEVWTEDLNCMMREY